MLAPRLGGGPYNVALAAARLGVPTAFLSRLSTDAFGDALAHRLAESAVDTSLVQRGPEPTTLAVVTLERDSSARYSFYTDGTDLFRMLHDELERVKDGQFALRDVFDDFLKRVNFGGDDVMESYTVLGGDDAPTRIVIDPRFSAGRPIIERTATPVFALLDEIEGGDDRRWIAEDFGLELAEVSYVADHREFLAPVA